MNLPTIEMKHIIDNKGNLLYKICNIAGIECKNNRKACACSVYAGDTELPNLFNY